MCKRRVAREPVQYIIGEWDFHCLTGIETTAPVLIPRPETEELVDLVIDHCKRHPSVTQLLEVGSGCGAVSIALLQSLPNVQVTAIDVDPAAVALTSRNAVRFGVNHRMRVLLCDIRDFPPANGQQRFDLLVSNPPYIPTAHMLTLEPEVLLHESRLALDGGPSGCDVISHLFTRAALWGHPAMFIEVDESHQKPLRELAASVGATLVERQDVFGRFRFVGVQFLK